MREEIVSFETAKLAKEKGFNHMKANVYGDNLAYYIGNEEGDVEEGKLIVSGNALNYVLAPTQSLLQKWLREEHDLIVFPINFSPYDWDVTVETTSINGYNPTKCKFATYEEALEVGLREALNRI